MFSGVAVELEWVFLSSASCSLFSTHKRSQKISSSISPIQKICFQGHSLYVKRDDLLDAADSVGSSKGQIAFKSAFSGNKARKLHYYLENDFPNISTLISYGSAQSNMLYSLSRLAQLKGWQLEFYVDHVAGHLKQNPQGNYAAALANGAAIYEAVDVERYEAKEVNGVDGFNLERLVLNHILPGRTDVLYIPEGGRSVEAESGIKKLAAELEAWVCEQQIEQPKVMLPSGTGTTALFLQKHLPFEVLSCACVGSDDYLRQQFSALNPDSGAHPRILPSPLDKNGQSKKYHFGKLYPEFYQIWQQLQQQTGITFELLYDPLGWLCMMDYLKTEPDATLIYLHQGGLLGNDSMVTRYTRNQR